MDGLSGAASVVAIVQIAVQLGQGNKQNVRPALRALQVCRFSHRFSRSLLHSINDAPRDIQLVVQELEFFDSILNQIRRDEEKFGSQPETYLALSRCDGSLKSLLGIAESLVPGFASNNTVKRTWAAIKVVRKNDKLASFKAKLQEAKLDLLIAQQTSATHAQYLNHKTYQESLATLNQGVAELCERFSYSSNTISPLTEQDASIPVEVSTEIHQAASFWGARSIQSGLETQLTQVVQNTFTSVLVEQHREQGQTPTMIDSNLIPCARLVERHSGRRAVDSSFTATRTMLGEMHCRVTTYRICKPSLDLGPNQSENEEKLEIETNFTLVPSWWVVRFGVAKVFKFDIKELSTQGWQANMATFNLVPSDSVIFDFCREGNLDAVRSLLTHGKASVKDVTAEGVTPLHVAASYCDADICALLLREGADTRVREHDTLNMTPFELACYPKSLIGLPLGEGMPAKKFEQTIRQFLRLDDRFDDLSVSLAIQLITVEAFGVFTNLNEKTPSMWLLYEIIPNI
ncbi:hypothetical protein EG329_009418 [Mollisiaceae sp. DMI_Dod_QoI]|nr:hypothetical protein EG329_009418 [Helotiales sp. DMI_Dod_QoI]